MHLIAQRLEGPAAEQFATLVASAGRWMSTG
jgi:hypothetical protein